MILTTRGRKSGRETSTPLFYARAGNCLYIAASFAGSGLAPQWHKNLLAHPEVTVQTSQGTGRYTARTLEASEAAGIWPLLDAAYPTYAKYRERAPVEIPVVELRPMPD